MPASSSLGLSEIAPSVIQSEIRAMSVECDRVGGINLAQGELASVVGDGAIEAIEAIRAGSNIYTRLDGIGQAGVLKTSSRSTRRRRSGSPTARAARYIPRCSRCSTRAMPRFAAYKLEKYFRY
jgi:hypothetical protein